jgi:ribosomal protein S18 acetylase RimI-like enzyme
MERVNIGTLGENEIQEAAKVVARAMGPTPFPMAMCQELNKSERVMETTVRVIFAHSPGQVLIAKKDRQVVGVLRMVKWPQCQMSSRQVRMLLPSMVRILKLGVIRAMRGRAVWAKYHPVKPHWHVDPLAVMPELQGQGVGSQLLERFCKIVDDAGESAYLETDRPENVRLYERFGFNVISEAPALGVHCYFMWRPSYNKDVE